MRETREQAIERSVQAAWPQTSNERAVARDAAGLAYDAARERLTHAIEALYPSRRTKHGNPEMRAYESALDAVLALVRGDAERDHGAATPICPDEGCESTGRCLHGTCPAETGGSDERHR